MTIKYLRRKYCYPQINWNLPAHSLPQIKMTCNLKQLFTATIIKCLYPKI